MPTRSRSLSRSASFWRLWGWPLGLGLLSASGLGCALVLDGAGDALACLALASPLVAITWHSFMKRSKA